MTIRGIETVSRNTVAFADDLDRLLTAVTYSDDADTSDSKQETKVVKEYDGWGNVSLEKQWQEWDRQTRDFKYKKQMGSPRGFPRESGRRGQ